MADKKKCTASNWQQLLKRRQTQFAQTVACLEENLTSLQLKQSNDEQVYQIEQVDQVIEESISLINNASQILMVEAEPDAVPLFKEALEQAEKRGIPLSEPRSFQAMRGRGIMAHVHQYEGMRGQHRQTPGQAE